MATFIPDMPIAGLKGADYNPRRIEESALEALAHSLGRLGVCKPIIVSGDLIVAGHQRTKTLQRLGRETAPAILLNDKVTTDDEIRFNQLHNGTDFDSGDEVATVGPGGEAFQFGTAPADQIVGNMRARMANVRLEICKLTQRYGNWGACVATLSGRVIHAAQYALACKAMNMPARVYRVPDDMEEEARELLSRQYGVFSYSHLDRKTYIQTFAQMYRLRDGAARAQKSALYETMALPSLKQGERILDFGCGQGDYVRHLSGKGVPILGIEFFPRQGQSIDGRAAHRMIDEVTASLTRDGLFDVVVCDSVLNSVDSLQAEHDVLTCCNAFCRPGGRIYLSGRTIERINDQNRMTKTARGDGNTSRYVEFLDQDGFTALYRSGNWFYQKFHSREGALRIGQEFIGTDLKYGKSQTAWTLAGTKCLDRPPSEVEAAICREFDLIWPNGRSVGRSPQMLAAWKAAGRIQRPQTGSSGTL